MNNKQKSKKIKRIIFEIEMLIDEELEEKDEWEGSGYIVEWLREAIDYMEMVEKSFGDKS